MVPEAPVILDRSGAKLKCCVHAQVHNETVERYDAGNDVWVMETVPVPEAIKRAFLSACVVDAF